MLLIWNHSFGRQEQQDLVVCRPYAIPESYEEMEMVEDGWLALDRPLLYEGSLLTTYNIYNNKKRIFNYSIL